jgi:hypothetical protein
MSNGKLRQEHVNNSTVLGKGKLEKIKEISNISKFCPKQFTFATIKLDQIDNRESFDSIHIQTKNNKVTSLLYRHEIQGKPKIKIIFYHWRSASFFT